MALTEEEASAADASLKFDRGATSGPRVWTAAELMSMEFPEPRWAVRDFYPEGATLLAGASKIGKSWKCLGLAIAVASGGRAFGQIPVEKGRVLYIAFEDHPARMKSRLSRLLQDQPAPEGLHIVHQWPRLGAAPDAITWLKKWVEKYPDTRLIIIDTFNLIRPIRQRHGNVYVEDYEDAHALQGFAVNAGVALLAIHHTNQGKHDEDPFHAISGSEGLNAGFDAIAVLKRGSTSSTGSLEIRGRDVGERKHVITYDFQTMQWTLPGYKLSREREELLSALREVAPADLGYSEVAVRLGKNEAAAKQLLISMYAESQVKKRSPGRYYIDPDNANHDDHDSYVTNGNHAPALLA
jgi:hypothetical protein